VWAIAHRGASKDRPQNTLAAFDEALRQRCDAIELDLQLSRDAVPVVYHDSTLVRAGGGRRRVASLSFDELRRLESGSSRTPGDPHWRIPALDEVIERYASRTHLLLEIKLQRPREATRALTRLVVDRVGRLAGHRPVFLLCFDREVLTEAGRRSPDLACVLNVGRGAEATLRRDGWSDGLSAVSIDVATLTPRVEMAVQRSGLPLFVFTCNTDARVRRALDAGADGVMSDRPGWLRERLDSLSVVR
jgi:glycerophosphoryl diester phosphodiesterase